MKFTVKSIALSGVAFGMFMSAAHAADAVVITSNWTGFSIGVGGGMNFADADMSGAGYGVFASEDWDCWDTSSCPGSAEADWSPYGGVTELEEDLNVAMGATAGFGDFVEAVSALDIEDELLGLLNGAINSNSNDSGNLGFSARGELGADYQFGDHFVVGLNAAYAFGKTSVENSGAGAAGGQIEDTNIDDDDDDSAEVFGIASVDSELTVEDTWSVGARAGFVAMENWLVFGTVGYTQSKAELSASFEGEAGADLDGRDAAANWNIDSSNSEWMDGVYFGGGVEGLITENVSLKFEYRYVDLGSIETSHEFEDFDFDEGDGDGWQAATGVSANADVAVHSVFATMSYRF